MNCKLSKKDIVRCKDRLSQHHLKNQQHSSLIQSHPQPPSLTKPLHPKNRKHSRRDLRTPNSPTKLIRSKSKTAHSPSLIQGGDHIQGTTGNINALYHELMTIKSEYTHLKTSYHQLAEQKGEVGGGGVEEEVERIKRECYKVLEAEKFKNKRLQQTIEEKDLMIAHLRQELDRLKTQPSTLANVVIDQQATQHTPMQQFQTLLGRETESQLGGEATHESGQSECPTFQQRNPPQLQPDRLVLQKREQQTMKAKAKYRQIPPKSMPKHSHTRKIHLTTDQNWDINRQSASDLKLSHQHGVPSCRKKKQHRGKKH